MSDRLRKLAAVATVTCGATLLAIVETAPRLRNG